MQHLALAAQFLLLKEKEAGSTMQRISKARLGSSGLIHEKRETRQSELQKGKTDATKRMLAQSQWAERKFKCSTAGELRLSCLSTCLSKRGCV